MPPKKKRKGAPKEKPIFIKWRKSDAKQKILTDLGDGVLDPATPPESAWLVYKKVAGFEKVPWEQFKQRYEDHIDAFVKKRERSQRDEMLFQHDRQLHPCNETHDDVGRLIFSRHPAMTLLQYDIKHGYYPHYYKTPSELWGSRPEHKDNFEVDELKRRIYQEQRAIKFKNWCEKKRSEKEEQKAQHRRQRDYSFD